MKKQFKSHAKALKVKLFNAQLRRKNIKGFKPTVALANNWFHILNRGMFNSKLSMCPIYVKKLHHDWGRCIADWDNRQCRKGTFDQRVIPYEKADVFFRLELHCKFPTWKDFIETLAHEMVHLYQMTVMKDPYSNHNANFYSFRKTFKQTGLKLYR